MSEEKKKEIKKIKKAIKYNAKTFFLFVAGVMIWWAIWGFLDLIFPYSIHEIVDSSRILGYVIVLFAGIAIIYLGEYELEDFIG